MKYSLYYHKGGPFTDGLLVSFNKKDADNRKYAKYFLYYSRGNDLSVRAGLLGFLQKLSMLSSIFLFR